jgi:hypothetical protein
VHAIPWTCESIAQHTPWLAVDDPKLSCSSW